MSGDQPKNEDLIEELTSGLSECLKPREDIKDTGGGSGTPSSSHAHVADPTDESAFEESPKTSAKNTPLEDLDQDPDGDKHEESDEDDVDEEALKDLEVTLTEDQKQELKILVEELKNVGNDAFKRGEYELSIEKYTEGLMRCPLAFSRDRAILYCNRSAAKMKLEKYSKAISDCTKSIELDDKYVKAYIRRAQSYESTDKLDESLADFKKILELDPSNAEANRAVLRLPPLIEKKNEKLKEEMLGKLKELGNMILKPFGLSTANFQVNQDPESKGYSINFKQ